MNLKVVFDREVDVLRLVTGEDGETSASLAGLEDVVVDLATADGHHIIGVEVMGGSAYLPLGKRGYDPETDTLTLGTAVSDPALITENGDIVGYWEADRIEPDSFMDPVGVAIRQASKHLDGVPQVPSRGS